MIYLRRVFGSCLAAGLSVSAQAEEGGFIEGSHADLQLRDYFFSRDSSGIVGSNPQSRTQEWAQGFIFDLRSGYTQVDVLTDVSITVLAGEELVTEIRPGETIRFGFDPASACVFDAGSDLRL